jgi:class 3 adenylate cyclase
LSNGARDTGPLLNHTARILSKAAGGQVLVDSPTWEHIQRKLEKDHALMAVGLGEFELKGVERPVCLYQVSNEVRQRNVYYDHG